MRISQCEIDKSSPLPYYYQIERYIKSALDHGNINKNELLPSEGKLAKAFNVSIGVVRQAFNRLEQDGLIVRQKGKRAFIKSNPKLKIEFSHKQYGGYRDLEQKGLTIKTKVLENVLVNPEEKLLEKFKTKPAKKIIQLTRVRFVDNQPVIFWITCLPSELCPGLHKMDLEDVSLNEFILEKYGIKTFKLECSLDVVHGEQFACNCLEVMAGEPLIYIESVNYLANNKVFQYTEAWHPADYWTFTFNIHPEDRLSD